MAKTIYTLRYGHSDIDTPGNVRMLATDDKSAIIEAKKACRDGFRNQSWARVELSTGQVYACRNVHGEVISRIIEGWN